MYGFVSGGKTISAFELYLIKPTRYDADGYPMQWWRTLIPSNSLASLHGIALEAQARKPLGDDVEINIHTLDEENCSVLPDKIAKDIKKSGNKALICLVGVQTNQFPRAVDLGRQFIKKHGLPVCVGGFHVSGCLSMLKEMPKDMVEAQEIGLSFFAGEAEEERFDHVLIDAYKGSLKPIYGDLKNTPNMAGAPIPIIPRSLVERTLSNFSSFDLGRGCPFECSFCTIINVQGRKSRFRTADDLEKIVRENAKTGTNAFFVTDDNFARNKNWREFTDRLIKLRREEGIKVRLLIQVDTLAHRIDGFIEACIKAGTSQVFIGLESINADSLEQVKKRQNRIEEYRDMFLAWKKYPVFLTCGYIVGFPTDTPQSIASDIETLKQNLPIDALYLNFLTPLPGSMDHKLAYEAGQWMDPDLNQYTLTHRVSHHPTMTDEEWERAHREAHKAFYSWDHIETIIKRMFALKSNKKYATVSNLTSFRVGPILYGVSAFESGLFRRYVRRQRRYGMKLENPLIFYPKFLAKLIHVTAVHAFTYMRILRIMKRVLKDPNRQNYTDAAISRDEVGEQDALLTDTRVTDVTRKRMANKLPPVKANKQREKVMAGE